MKSSVTDSLFLDASSRLGEKEKNLAQELLAKKDFIKRHELSSIEILNSDSATQEQIADAKENLMKVREYQKDLETYAKDK